MENENYNEIEKNINKKVVDLLLHKRNIIEFNSTFSISIVQYWFMYR